jgi:acyl-CoA synthetase (AMP-forming)/AMP-acid ligase II
VRAERIVNQYGMTELGSQFYDSVLAYPGEPRRKLGPPWARVRIVDPETGLDAVPGEVGMIVVHDLANTGSIAAILTEDLGRFVSGGVGAEAGNVGFEVLGRHPDAEARGCSIAADLMLSA